MQTIIPEERKSQPPPMRGKVIVEFERNGAAARVMPIASTDEECRALIDAFQLAAQVGDFSNLSQRGGRF